MALVLNGSGSITGVTDLATAGVALEDAALTDPVVTGGVYLGGTGAANYLDDYEEGTWTPVFGGSSSNPTSVSYQLQEGSYTKIGRTVFVRCFIGWKTYTGGSGNIYITGLPFTNTNGNGYYAIGAGMSESVTLSSGYTQINPVIPPNSSRFAIFEIGSTKTWDTLAVSAAPSSATDKYFMFSASYEAA